jgi:predicted dehydrogenase
MLEYLCGPITSVMAQMTDKTTAGHIGGAPYTTLAVALGFADGAVGTLLGTYDSSYAYPGTQLIEINGTAGRAVIEDTVRSLSLSTAGDETTRVWRAGYFNDEARTFAYTFDRHVDALLDAFRAGAEPPVHARAGRRALELAEAIILSFEQGVRVPTEPDRSARTADLVGRFLRGGFLDCQLGRRVDLETLVWNARPALHGDAEGAGREPLVGAVERGETVAQ